MISIFETKNVDLIKSVDDLEPNLTNINLMIAKDNVIVGVAELRLLTATTCILGLVFKKEHRYNGLILEIYKPLLEYVKNNTNYKVLLGTVAVSNKAMLRAVEKTIGRVCGLIQDGICLNNKFEDLVIVEVQLH